MVHFDRVLHLDSLAKQLGPHIQCNIAFNGEWRKGWACSDFTDTSLGLVRGHNHTGNSG